MRQTLITVTLLLIPHLSWAGNSYEHFPTSIDSDGRYIFYSHGYIVEGDNPKPEHPRWGVYDFPMIKEVLAGEDYHLIAHHRPKNTDPHEFAETLSSQATLLLKSGVKADKITFVGFSRGGAITILVSNLLKLENMNFAILAGCGGYLGKNTSVKLYGRVLSIRERSDDLANSCTHLAARSDEVASFEEITISTGKEHGAFYRPLSEWVEPLKAWMKK